MANLADNVAPLVSAKNTGVIKTIDEGGGFPLPLAKQSVESYNEPQINTNRGSLGKTGFDVTTNIDGNSTALVTLPIGGKAILFTMITNLETTMSQAIGLDVYFDDFVTPIRIYFGQVSDFSLGGLTAIPSHRTISNFVFGKVAVKPFGTSIGVTYQVVVFENAVDFGLN